MGLNLTQQQNANTLIGLGAGSAVYNLSNPNGTQIVVGAPLVFPSDINAPGYTALGENQKIRDRPQFC